MKIKANAKINFNLGICGKRQDGYHLIDTVMHSVSLYDTLQIEKEDKITVSCSNKEIDEKDNIANKAARLFFEKTDIKGGAKIEINKNIPTCAGLGGGSADAAAVLCGLNEIYDAKLSEQQLCEMALNLGADVPFFIKGGCQRAQGIGEVLTSYKPLEDGYILLAKADKKPSTAEMYRLIDKNELVIVNTEKVIENIEKNDLKGLSKSLYNAFEEVWNDSSLKPKLYDFSPLAVALTGSGPTWFVLFDNLESAENLKLKLLKENIECYIVTPKSCAIEFE